MTLPRQHLILFGFPACGKSTLGRHLSKRFHFPHVDTDLLIQEQHGGSLSCREIYLKEGPEFFRSLERTMIATLPHRPPSIVSLGGGAILDPGNLELLLPIGTLVYLQLDRLLLEKRWTSTQLPSFVKNSAVFYNERLPQYLAVPSKTIDLSKKTLDEVAIELFNIWNHHG